MELLARRAVSGGGGVPGHQGRGRLLVALYRTKRNQAKRAAARGEDVVPAKKPSKRGNNGGRPSASGKSNKKDASSKQAPVEPVEQRPSAEEIEKSWGAMRARTPLVPPPIMTVRSRKEVENTMRMKRLGLLPEDAEGEWEGYVESKNHPEMRGHRSMQRPLSSENPTSGRRTARRPVSEKAKQFINMQSAPEEVMQREFLIPDEPEFPKALDVAVIGRPNAGKSSIMNSLLDTTVSAVSAKYNTTRDRVLGILTKKDSQIAFYDTPGLIKPKESHEYVRSLVTTAAETVESVDMSMLVVDAVKRLDDSAMDALEKVITASAQVSSPIMLVMNKCDLVGKREEINMDLKIRDISQMIEEIFKDRFDPDESSLDLGPLAYIGDNALKVSALKGNGMRHLEKTLVSLAVDRPWSYHSSMVSDQSDLDLVTEIIREKLFRRFNKELPYAIEQENVGWTKFKDKSIRIDQDIFVPAPRIRKMVVGHNGDTIRAVGVAARLEIEQLLKRPVHLYLNVRVRS